MAIDSEEKLVEDVEERDIHEEADDVAAGDLVEVVFKGNRRAVFRSRLEGSVDRGTYVIVEADKGEDIGQVAQQGDSLKSRRKGKRKSVLRIATERELGRWRQLRPREDEAYKDFQSRVSRREMPMKPVDVEYQLDGKKICFYFTADHRVDFRELVRELASVYRTRIELRQIGVRDEAKRLGGIGPCGRELCCTTFLTEFAPITSQMARDQNLSLNPSKLSGICGRLKCCLRFEHDFYRAQQDRFPKLGSRFTFGEHHARVNKLDFFRDTVTLRFEEGNEQTIPLDRLAERSRQGVELPVNAA